LAASFSARYAGQKYDASVIIVDMAVKTGTGLAWKAVSGYAFATVEAAEPKLS
jgi:hypothetical protein